MKSLKAEKEIPKGSKILQFTPLFRKEYLPTQNNRQKWRSTANETHKEGDLVWLIEDSDKRVKLAPVLTGKDVFAMENRAGDVVAELTNSMTKLNSAPRSFQAVQFRIAWQAKFIATFYRSHTDRFTLFNIYI